MFYKQFLYDKSKILSIIIIAVILGISVLDNVYAATIHGTVYDIMLYEQEDVLLRIDTIPNQFYVAKTGEYSFNVSPGNYTIKASSGDGEAQESISVLDDGDYVIDLVLDPKIDEPPVFDLTNEAIINPNFEIPADRILLAKDTTISTLMFVIISAIVFISVVIFVLTNAALRQKNKKSKESNLHHNSSNDNSIELSKEVIEKSSKPLNDRMVNNKEDYKNTIIEMIKSQSRLTQKDLRKQIPLSEGKISLIVSELEHDGVIKKIKKGRGNILVYKKE